MVDYDARPENFAAIGDAADEARHLDWGGGDFLADAEVGEVPFLQFRRLIRCRHITADFWCFDSRLFAEVKTMGYFHQLARAGHFKAVGNEIRIARFVERTFQIEVAFPSGVVN